ncbi:MAG: GIY-YIG nuclease family protein [Gammaproteobacteria bacterium]|nr:GIY-YIG nuclease family protein [Gammaproteobacteria bacterium]
MAGVTKPLPRGRGAYALLVRIMEPLRLHVGQLGELRLTPGYCVYVGSALGSGGLQARVAHHARVAIRPHWHMDYLRRHTPLIEVWYSVDPVRREHQWATLFQDLGGVVPLSGFGSSDCCCPAHLFHFSHPPALTPFAAHLQVRHPDHAPLECWPV